MNVSATIARHDAVARSWDSLVVGAGPAGSVAARELARRGLSVLLVDKAAFPRRKVCGCCLNGAAVGTLRAVGLGDLPDRLGAVVLTRVRLAAGGRSAALALPSGVALSRESLDSSLIREAVAAGVHFLPNTTVKTTVSDRAHSPSVTLHTDGERNESATRTRVLIAADGLNGRSTSADGTHSVVWESSRIGAGVMADVAPSDYEPGTIFMATARGGYVGLVRVEDGRLDVAAAFDPGFVRASGGLGNAAESVLRSAGLPPVPGLAELSWRGTPPLTRTSRRRSGPKWFAIGDAAGYVEPFTGEGMAWAVASAVAVAPIAAKAVATGWNPGLAREWEAAYHRVVRSRQDLCRTTAWVLRSPALTRIAVNALSLSPGLAGPVVSRLNRPHRLAPPVTEVVA